MKHKRLRPVLMLTTAVLLLAARFEAQGETLSPEEKEKVSSGHRTNTIEGWTVLVSERLLAEEGAATQKALGLLRVQLQEIARVVPPQAVARLREVTLWFSPEYPG